MDSKKKKIKLGIFILCVLLGAVVIFFLLKRASKKYIKYSETIVLKTKDNNYLGVDLNDNKRIIAKGMSSDGTNEFLILKAPIKDGELGKTYNENETFVKYGDIVQIKSKKTNLVFYMSNASGVTGSIFAYGDRNNRSGYWESQAYKIVSPVNKSGFISADDTISLEIVTGTIKS